MRVYVSQNDTVLQGLCGRLTGRSMADIAHLMSRLGSIAEASSLGFADLAAGHKDGLQLRFRFTGSTAISSANPSPEQPGNRSDDAADIADRRYLIASITKPLVVMLAVQLAVPDAVIENVSVVPVKVVPFQ